MQTPLLEDTRTMAEYCHYHDMLTETRKMTDETNEANLNALRGILPYFYLNRQAHNKVLHHIDEPPHHPLWTREMNNQHRLIIPVTKTEHTDIAYGEFKNLISNSFIDIPFNDLIAINNYDTWVSGRMPNGMKLFKYLLKAGIHEGSLERITTIRQTDKNYLVISKNPVDWLFMATNQSFSSCMSLNSEHCDAFYYGLPEMMVDHHRYLVFLTNGKLRSYNVKGHEFKHFRMINRSIAIWTDEQRLALVRYYPSKTIDYRHILHQAGFLLDSRFLEVGQIWQSFNWPQLPTLYFEDETTQCQPYLDHNRQHDYSERGERYNNMGGYGSRMSGIYWTDGFARADSFEDINSGRSCDWCSRRIDSEGGYWYEDENICRRCYEDYIRCCEDCSHEGHTDNMHWISSCDYYVCHHCINDYTACNSCDDLYPSDEIGWDEIDQEHLCEYCATLEQCSICSITTQDDNLEDGICQECRHNLIAKLEEIENQMDDLKSTFQDEYEDLKVQKEELEAQLGQ